MVSKNSSIRIKEDTLELAQIVFDVFVEEEMNANIDSGQNNTNHENTD